jgi:hypothetical protein
LTTSAHSINCGANKSAKIRERQAEHSKKQADKLAAAFRQSMIETTPGAQPTEADINAEILKRVDAFKSKFETSVQAEIDIMNKFNLIPAQILEIKPSLTEKKLIEYTEYMKNQDHIKYLKRDDK